MYYSRIYSNGAGFTNQIFALISSIILAYKNNHRIIIVDNFLNDYSKNNFTLISEILDIEKTNSYLRNKYNIVIADKYNVKFDIDSIYYGINDKKINITNEIKNQFLVNSNIHIPKNTILNNINGDPSPGIVKKLYITYKINNEKIVEEYSENLLDDIYIYI